MIILILKKEIKIINIFNNKYLLNTIKNNRIEDFSVEEYNKGFISYFMI